MICFDAGGGGRINNFLLHRRKLLEGNNHRRLHKEEAPSACLRLGSASNDGSQAGATFDVNGVFQCVAACTHGYAIGNILEEQL